MKNIGSVKEDLTTEKRISITPETAKKFIDLNFSVFLEKKYGEHLGITDDEYKNEGAILYDSVKEILEKSQIILKVNCPSNDEINSIKDKSILIGQFDPLSDKEKINKLIKKILTFFHLICFLELREHNQWMFCPPRQIWLDIGRLLNLSKNLAKRFL